MYGDRLGHEHTGRGLEDLDARLGHGVVEGFIARRRATSPGLRVLEIGCGEGRVLMELRRRFPTIELHGINRAPWPAMRGSESLMGTARYYGIFSEGSLEHAVLPHIHFCDAAALPLPSEYFDLIFSQAAFHFVRRKDQALEEIVRVLRPGGEAHVHMDSTPRPSSAFANDDPTPRFIIRRGSSRLCVTQLLTDQCDGLAAIGTDFVDRDDGGRLTILRLRKMSFGTVRLGLRFDPTSSFALESPPKDISCEAGYGFRSVFDIAPA